MQANGKRGNQSPPLGELHLHLSISRPAKMPPSVSALESLEAVYTDCPSGARIFSYCRRGRGLNEALPILVLLHGYPQNNLMYKQFVNEVPGRWRLLVPDLPG